MNYRSLLISLGFATFSFLWYRLHKWWKKGRKDNPLFFKPDTFVGVIKDWIVIVLTAIASLVYFFEAIA